MRYRVDLAAETDGVRLTVDDEGPGIPPALRRQVFTKFWRHGARGGSGLGLYVVHGLVRAHGGSVLIDDAPGGGARLVVAVAGVRRGRAAPPLTACRDALAGLTSEEPGRRPVRGRS